MEEMNEPHRSEQVEAMKEVVNTMMAAWYMRLSQKTKDALPPADLKELRDGFIAICMLGIEDR